MGISFRRFGIRLVVSMLVFGLAIVSRLTADDASPQGWRLTWSDEFDGDSLDRKNWDFDQGNGFFNYEANQWIHGWGNGELQYYTSEPTNVSVSDGLLRIRAIKESLHGCGYTSARIKTRRRDGTALFAQRYGRFEARAKLPTGQGVWPAIWMLPQDETYGGWAASGEIDILEVRGQKPREVLGTIHYAARWPANAESSVTYELPNDGRIDQFHTYTVEWEPGDIRWYVDDQLFSMQKSWWSSSKTVGGQGARPANEADLNPWPAPFDQSFYLVMNLAIGGQFVGNPDQSTPFPAEMQVDYVRVYERAQGYGPVPARDDATIPFARPGN